MVYVDEFDHDGDTENHRGTAIGFFQCAKLVVYLMNEKNLKKSLTSRLCTASRRGS